MSKTFRDIQPGNTLFVLSKGEKLTYEETAVVSVSQPRADVLQQNNQFPMQMQGIRQVVDVTYTIAGKTYTDTTDINLSVLSNSQTGFPVMVSTEKEYVINELKETLKQSEQVLKSVEKHKKRVKDCKTLIAEIDTEYNEKVQTENRLSKLEESSIKTNELLQQLLEKINKNKLF